LCLNNQQYSIGAKNFSEIIHKAKTCAHPVEIETELNQEIKTGDEVEIDLENKSVKIIASGKTCGSKDLGAVKAVIEAGGIFDYARNSGMIEKK
jgi:3-isopropylmalate/(R)-2-methylmalate dehydratase small subunit